MENVRSIECFFFNFIVLEPNCKNKKTASLENVAPGEKMPAHYNPFFNLFKDLYAEDYISKTTSSTYI